MSELLANQTEGTRPILPDELPRVGDLSSDFDYLLAGYRNNKYRIGMVLEYGEHLKARFESGVYSSPDNQYAREQILPRVYLDTLMLTAGRQKFNSVVNLVGHRFSDRELNPLRDLIGAKLDLQADLAEYVRLNPGSDSQAIFGNLSQMMHHSRRLLYGDEVSHPKGRQEGLYQLSAILAEYKVLSALRESWPHATFGSVEQDRLGTDIVVPSVPESDTGVALQVKSSIKPTWDLLIRDIKGGASIVNVPMNPSLHDPLSLSPEHSDKLRLFVRSAPSQNLALAA